MIKYTITMEEDGVIQTAYIDKLFRPLIGDEPVIKQRFQSLTALIEVQDAHFINLKEHILNEWTS